MNKNYREYIGRLARYDQSGRSSIFINRMNIIQYNVKTLLLPDAATSFVTGFGNLLSDFSDDIYAGDDARIDNFEAFMENQLFIFKVQTKNVNGMEVRSMTDVHLVPVPKSFDQSTEFYAVPVFCSKNDEEVPRLGVQQKLEPVPELRYPRGVSRGYQGRRAARQSLRL